MNDEQTQPDAPKTSAPRRMSLRRTLFRVLFILIGFGTAIYIVVSPLAGQERLLNELESKGVSFYFNHNDPKSISDWVREPLGYRPSVEYYDGPFVPLDPDRTSGIGVFRHMTTLRFNHLDETGKPVNVIVLGDSEAVESPGAAGGDRLWWLSESRDLERVYLDHPFTDAELSVLGRMDKLTFVTVNSQKLNGSYLKHLNAGVITDLGILKAKTTETWAEGLASYSKLNSVDLIVSIVDPVTVNAILEKTPAKVLVIERAVVKWPDVADNSTSNMLLVWFKSSFIDDSAFRAISRLPKVGGLVIEKAQFAAAKLGELARSKTVETIIVKESGITDESLAALGRVASLENLQIPGSAITSRGIAHLAGLTGLKHLIISKTKVDDAAAEHLLKLTALNSLDMTDTDLGDKGFEQLLKLEKLEELNVGGTKVTAKGLEALFVKRPLQTISLNSSILTDEVREKIEEANPDLTIRIVEEPESEPCP